MRSDYQRLQWRAQQAINRAVKSGKAQKPGVCQSCGAKGPVQAHHDDYTKPLDVQWICASCHGRRHRVEALPDFAPLASSIIEVTVKRYVCAQCKHVWSPRADRLPHRCPHCGTHAWNREKRKRGRPRKLLTIDEQSLAKT